VQRHFSLYSEEER